MKRVLTFLLIFVFASATLPLSGTDQAPSECDYEMNKAHEECTPIGYGADHATQTTVNMSMVGWGLGLALAIALVAGIIHQSAAVHSSSTSSSS